MSEAEILDPIHIVGGGLKITRFAEIQECHRR
jgi:hypothetical protein